MTLQELLQPIRERLDKATPGKWSFHETDKGSIFIGFEIRVHQGTLFRSTSYNRMAEDAELIANAPTDLKRLILALECAEKSILEKCSAEWCYGKIDGDCSCFEEIKQILSGAE